MNIDLAFTPAELEKKDLQNKTVVVIDALRATSTMITAFENGCSAFIPVCTIEEAQKLVADRDDPKSSSGRGAQGIASRRISFGEFPP